MTVRAFFQAVHIPDTPPPYDTIQIKVFYPAQQSGSDLERNMGVVPADTSLAPFPVIIFFPAVNCSSHQYSWLAAALAEKGLVVITYDWIAENLPGRISLSPGIHIAGLQAEHYGKQPTAAALTNMLGALQREQEKGILAGLLDLERIILGGHSAGGTLALQNANPFLFPQVKAAFAYCANVAMTTVLGGYSPDTHLPMPNEVPMLLLAASHDGVIEEHNRRFGIKRNVIETHLDTFQHSISSDEAFLLILADAGHYSIAHPLDKAIGRAFLDDDSSSSDALRAFIASVIGSFIERYLHGQNQSFEAHLMHHFLQHVYRK